MVGYHFTTTRKETRIKRLRTARLLREIWISLFSKPRVTHILDEGKRTKRSLRLIIVSVVLLSSQFHNSTSRELTRNHALNAFTTLQKTSYKISYLKLSKEDRKSTGEITNWPSL